MTWTSLSRALPWHRSRNREGQLRLTQAYRNVFSGNPSRDDQQIVLADLANVSGFQRVFPSEVSTEVLRYSEGKRALYAHIFSFLSLSPSDVSDLEQAARREAAIDQQQHGQHR